MFSKDSAYPIILKNYNKFGLTARHDCGHMWEMAVKISEEIDRGEKTVYTTLLQQLLLT